DDTTPANASQAMVDAINFEALEGGAFDGLVKGASYDGVTDTITIEYEKGTEDSGRLSINAVSVAVPYSQFVDVVGPSVDKVGTGGGEISFGISGSATEDGTITVTLPDLPTDGSAWNATDVVTVDIAYEFGDTAAEISSAIRTGLIAATGAGGDLEDMVKEVDYDTSSGRLTLTYEDAVSVPQTAIAPLTVESTAQAAPDEPTVITYPANAAQSLVYNSGASAQLEADKILAADERIASLEVDSNTNSLLVTFKAEATDVDLIQFNNLVGGTLESHTSSQIDANEIHTYQLNDRAFESGSLVADTVVSFAGVEVQLENGMDEEEVAAAITAAESKIIDSEPKVESVTLQRSGADYSIIVTYKPDESIEADEITVTVGSVGDSNVPVLSEKEVVDGDSSYQGVYRMYAYLNGEQQLNVGKVVDPGETGSASNATEVGPILIKFDPSNGFLTAVNGNSFSAGGAAPKITITGADPASAETTISLDITGSTQFASDSIVKASVQDGYTKGDLVGVTFGESGEMIASFSNGQSQNLGVVAIATFENQAGLQPSGDTEWVASINSGDAILNPPGTGLNGTLQSAALEQSNVDLSAELVNLIEAQRNFQANSKTLETLNTVTQAILQI
ncbi:flagellar hook-basal body complex protein, partial [Pontibacterium sp.]|uniref:flagellar hook-basal body complex protein n=1 Tax=Pontibacterium sp. TaxID=2036026 RepID=UPI0035620A75